MPKPVTPVRDNSMYGFHGSACPYHCVCNDTHLSWRCWCNSPRYKLKLERPWWAGLRARLLGGGRARGRFDCPC